MNKAANMSFGKYWEIQRVLRGELTVIGIQIFEY